MIDNRCHSSFKTVYTSHVEKICTEGYKKACKIEMVDEEVVQERELQNDLLANFVFKIVESLGHN